MTRYFLPFLTVSFQYCFAQKVGGSADFQSHDAVIATEENLSRLPLMFRKNMGQWDEKILFSGSARSANVYFMKNELSFGFIRPAEKEEEGRNSVLREAMEIQDRAYGRQGKDENEMLVWNVKFQGANPNSVLTSRGQAESKANYFLGNDPKKYCMNVPDSRILSYENIYANIDLKYYGSNTRLKYDFVIRPNGNAEEIRMAYSGIRKIRISRRGELLLSTPWGEMKEERPFTYQFVKGRKMEIKSTYVLYNDSTVGFKMLQSYDETQELIIDPIILNWATFVAGTQVYPSMAGAISKITMDAAGNVYAVGSYNSTFPTTPGSYNTAFGGGSQDVFVFKLNTTGTTLIYSTYIGGNQWDNGGNIFLNAANEVYITGQTSSFNWPTTAGAYDVTNNGGGDIFITKLNAAGSALLFSTFLGGTGSDMGADITLDPAGNIYVAGNTSSLNYPTSAGAFQTTLKGPSDMIVSKLNATATTLVYSTLIGSSKSEYGVGIGVNAAGEATVGGNSDSLDFPTTAGAYDQTFNDGPNPFNMHGDMVVFKLNATASSLIFSTFLGGNSADNMQGFYLSVNDEAFVCGVLLFTTNFPMTPCGVNPTTMPSTFDSFVARFNSTGSSLIYATYLGNKDPSSDEARDIWVNANSEAYVTGDGGSFASFPVVGSTPCATCTGGEDIYVCKLDPTGSYYIWTYFAGSKHWDICGALAVNVGASTEEIALGFGTNSLVFPMTAGSFQPVKPTPTDSMNTQPAVLKISTTYSLTNAGPDMTICAGTTVTLTGTGVGSYVWNPGGQTATSIVVSPSTTISYTLSNSCGLVIDSVKVTIGGSINASIAGNISVCAGQSTTLTASGGGNYSWNTGATTAGVTITPTASASYSVIVSSGSCPPDTSVANLVVSNPPNASITGNVNICGGQSATLTASGGVAYSWSSGGTNATLIISPAASSTYTVTVDNGSGCKATATQSVAVSPVITTSVSSTSSGCTINNGTATAIAGGGISPFTYNWNNGQTSPTATALGPGTYTVTITDAAGCTKTQSVSVTSNSTLTVSISSTQSGCSANNGTATATASNGSPAYTYSWSNGQNAQTATGLAAGTYTATVTDANGCTKTQIATVTQTPGPVATANASPTLVTAGSSSTLTATGGGTYQWSPATGLSCTTCANPVATPGQTTNYCVIVTNANNCSDSACVLITIDIPCGNIYLPNAFSPNNDLENDWECVMGNCVSTMHIIIYNRWGEKVFESSDQNLCWDGTFRGKQLDSAVFDYHLEVTLLTGEKIFKKGNISLLR